MSTWEEVTDESVIPEGVAIQEYGTIGADFVNFVDKIDVNNIDFVTYCSVLDTEYPVSKAPQGSKSDTAT